MHKFHSLVITIALSTYAVAENHTFIAENANWSASANWDPVAPSAAQWTSGDTATIPSGRIAQMDLAIGSSNTGWPVVTISEGGMLQRLSGGNLTSISNPLILNGGELNFQRSFTFNGSILVNADTIIRYSVGGDAGFGGASVISGSGSLTFIGTSTGGNMDNTVRLSAQSPGFSGQVNIFGRIYTPNSASLGSGAIYVGANGFFDSNATMTNAITLNSGSIRSYGGGGRFAGPITLASDSYVDSSTWGNPANVSGSISGSYDIILGQDFPSAATAEGSAVFSGNNSAWTGRLIALKSTASGRPGTSFATPNALPGSSIIAPNGTVLTLSQDADWTMTNSFAGPITLNVGNNKNRRLTFQRATLAPSANETSTGIFTLNGRVTLADATLKLQLLSATTADLLVVSGNNATAANPAVVLNNAMLDVTCAYDASSLDTIVILQNNSTIPISGIFKTPEGDDLPEGAVVDLGSGRTAKITYTAAPNGTSIALKSFTTPVAHVPPQVDLNGGATELLAHSAILHGQVTAGTPVPTVFFCWGDFNPGSNTTKAWSHTIPMLGQNAAFSTTIYSLLPETTYYYACLAINYDGENWHEAWSPVASFTTSARRSMYWQNSGWNDSTTYDWSKPAYWFPAIPASAGDTGYITNSFTANINGDLGTENNRPTIVVEPGGRLYVRIGPVNATPVVLNGGSIFYSSRTRLAGGLHLQADSLVTSDDLAGDGSGRIIENITGPASVTLSTRGSTYFEGNNTNLFSAFHFGTGLSGILSDRALGYGPVFLEETAQISNNLHWHNQSLNVWNPFSGFGILFTGSNATGCTVTNSITPGSAQTGGTFTINTKKLTLTPTSSLHFNLWSPVDAGRLYVTNDDLTACSVILQNPALTIAPQPGFKIAPGDTLVLLHNAGVNAINGQFANLPEGSKIDFGHALGTLTYTHIADDDGLPNDIAISNIRLAGTLLLLR